MNEKGSADNFKEGVHPLRCFNPVNLRWGALLYYGPPQQTLTIKLLTNSIFVMGARICMRFFQKKIFVSNNFLKIIIYHPFPTQTHTLGPILSQYFVLPKFNLFQSEKRNTWFTNWRKNVERPNKCSIIEDERRKRSSRSNNGERT